MIFDIYVLHIQVYRIIKYRYQSFSTWCDLSLKDSFLTSRGDENEIILLLSLFTSIIHKLLNMSDYGYMTLVCKSIVIICR